jgi:hypothetical protein
MGLEDYESFTESGLRYSYRFFLLGFSITLSMLIVSLMLYFNQEKIWEVTSTKIYFVLTIFFLFLIVFMYFIRGISVIFNARKEFETDHELNVVLAILIFIAFFIIFFINLSLSWGFTGGSSLIAFASMGFDSSLLIVFIVIVIFSTLVYILLGLASTYLVQGLITKKQQKTLKKAFVLFALSTFTLNITGLFAYVLFYSVYRDTYVSLNKGNIKAVITAPCPGCNREIPIESQVCPHCATELILEEVKDEKPPQIPEEEEYDDEPYNNRIA